MAWGVTRSMVAGQVQSRWADEEKNAYHYGGEAGSQPPSGDDQCHGIRASTGYGEIYRLKFDSSLQKAESLGRI